MKKMIKLSLVAAVAVAGLTTSVSAKDLSEAIKGTDISGAISVGYNNYVTSAAGVDAVTDNNEVEYDFYVKTKVPVNDSVTFTASVENDYSNESDADETTQGGERVLYVKEINFAYAGNGATFMVGKQGVGTPWTSSVRGDGMVATYAAGPVTVAGATFQSTTLLGDSTVNAAAVLGGVAGINFELWALSASAADGYSAAVSANAGPANIAVRHTTSELTSATPQDTFTLTKIAVTAKAGPANITVAYGMTNDANVGTARSSAKTAGVALNKDNGESADMYMDQARLDDFNDATAFVVGVSVPVDAFTFGAKYLSGSSDDQNSMAVNEKVDFSELNVNVAYNMSKNFSISGLYSALDVDATTLANDSTNDRMEVSLNYSF